MSISQDALNLTSEVLSHWTEHALAQRVAYDVIAAFVG